MQNNALYGTGSPASVGTGVTGPKGSRLTEIQAPRTPGAATLTELALPNCGGGGAMYPTEAQQAAFATAALQIWKPAMSTPDARTPSAGLSPAGRAELAERHAGTSRARGQTHGEALPRCPPDSTDELPLRHDELLT
jgi:hypothetical protein